MEVPARSVDGGGGGGDGCPGQGEGEGGEATHRQADYCILLLSNVHNAYLLPFLYILRTYGLFQIRKPSTVHCAKNNLNLCIKRSPSRLEPRQQYNFGLGLLVLT